MEAMSTGKTARKKGLLRAKYKRRRLRATGQMKHIVRRKQKVRLKKRG